MDSRLDFKCESDSIELRNKLKSNSSSSSSKEHLDSIFYLDDTEKFDAKNSSDDYLSMVDDGKKLNIVDSKFAVLIL